MSIIVIPEWANHAEVAIRRVKRLQTSPHLQPSEREDLTFVRDTIAELVSVAGKAEEKVYRDRINGDGNV